MADRSIPAEPTAHARPRNRFDRLEWAGAFGDLGTLIPFVVSYLTLLKLDATGVLLGFGVSLVAVGLVYRTPFPVQPMKAIGAVATTQAAQTIVIAPPAVYAAGLVTGVLWLLLGLSGASRRFLALVPRPVAVGIVLGLGFSFMLEGIRGMATGWWLGGLALVGTLALLTNRKLPAMFLLLLFGALAGISTDPALGTALMRIHPEWRLPPLGWASITWHDLLVGTLFLALPQLPLTAGNAVMAITEENNGLFPDRPVTERRVSVSTGAMNLVGSFLGGVPMCHGAGGMAGHVRFGARTGGAPVILGVILLVLGGFFSGSVETIFRILPTPVLGVILFLTGAQLALGSCDFSRDKGERFVTLCTAAFAVWNIGLAFLFGFAAFHAHRRGLFRV